MARPKKFCAVYDMGRVTHIMEGVDRARSLRLTFQSFGTRLAAEEHAAWWNYEAARDRPHLFPEEHHSRQKQQQERDGHPQRWQNPANVRSRRPPPHGRGDDEAQHKHQN